MLSKATLYTTAGLLALVGVACMALCLVWSIPAWRRRLASAGIASNAPAPGCGGLRGWPARIGSALVTAGIAACALAAWYGLYWALAAL